MCGDYYIGGRQFESLSDLIGYYTTCSCLPKNEQLIHPVAPQEVSGETCLTKQGGKADTEVVTQAEGVLKSAFMLLIEIRNEKFSHE